MLKIVTLIWRWSTKARPLAFTLAIDLAKQHANKADYPVGLIVLDHARLVMAGDPLSADHVTALLRALTRIAVETGAAVLLLAHSPKSTYGKEGEADPSEVFGS